MVEFFHLNPKYFPLVTRDYLPLETILRLGVLPLGIKRGWRLFRSAALLNVGFVSAHRAAVKEVKALVAGRSEVSGVQIYRVSPGEFLKVVTGIYGVSREQLLALPPPDLAPSVRTELTE